MKGIVPPIQELLKEFRKAEMPIFWSTWWRWGPEDGFFNSMDRFYGPVGWNTSKNALYNHNPNGGEARLDVFIACYYCYYMLLLFITINLIISSM